MLEMLRAHGLDAGPTQRPLLAGMLAGTLADAPALVVAAACGTLAATADAVPLAPPAAAAWHALAMAAFGAGYGLLFRRAANDPAGGWLFGLAYGFLVWMLAAVPLLQWLPDEPTLRGPPAAGLFLGQLAWGLVLGLVFRPVHRPLQGGVADERGGGDHRAGAR